MKHFVYLFVGILLTVVLTACSPQPRGVARMFVEDISKGKIENAKRHATDRMVSVLEGKSEDDLEAARAIRFTFVDQRIDGDRARVHYKKHTGGGGQVSDIILHRIDGKWKVEFAEIP